MPVNSHKSPIDKLDTPCLVRVLQHVSPQQQLVACGAVCSKWRAATREAISSIELYISIQEKCDQLQQWLVHPPAALYRLFLYGYPQPKLRLQLSVLQHLKELELDDVPLEAVAADGSVLTVADLLPRLKQCTKLTFHVWEDPQLTAAVAVFQAMPALHDLEVNFHDQPASLLSLPTTLTRLRLLNFEEAFDSTNAAGICQLTGLRVLEAEALGFDTSVLANSAGLVRVQLTTTSLLSGEVGFTTPLLVFASMPGLQHLELRSGYNDPVATAAEVAALSASSNLTYLSLGDGEYCALPPAAYDSWFPPGHQCPYLQYLDMGVWVLGNTAAVQRMVSACPGLNELELRSIGQDGMQVESACVAASLQALTNFTSLTCLSVGGRDLPEGSCISPAVADAWSQWTNLQQLDLYLTYGKLEDVLVLTQLRSLRTLSISGNAGCQYDSLAIKAQASGPPDVWCQLPAAVWGAAIRQKEKQVQQCRQEQQNAQATATALSQQHAAAQAKVAALQEQQAADEAELAALLQKQQQAEAAVLRQRLQQQQDETAATRQQAEAGQSQIAQLQSQVSTLQATVTSLEATVAALLERQD